MSNPDQLHSLRALTIDEPAVHAAGRSWMPAAAGEELLRAKCELLRWCDDSSIRPSSLLYRHPMAIAVAALAGAVVLARLPAARRVAGIAALWALQAAWRRLTIGRADERTFLR